MYLGYRIDQRRLHPLQDKMEANQKARSQKNVQELHAFLALLVYYGRFFYKLLCKGQKWFWGPQQQRSFPRAKELCLSAEVLAHYDPTKPILLQCDASTYGLGAVLSQIMGDGNDRPVGFVSRTLNASERNYSQFALKKFHKQLYGRCFVITTEHKPLLSVFGELKQVPIMSSSRVQWWTVTLREYEYKIHYKAGRSHGNADYLGRLPLSVTVKET